MLVKAAIAAYLPPPAAVPQMVSAIKRAPTSRAALVATVDGQLTYALGFKRNFEDAYLQQWRNPKQPCR